MAEENQQTPAAKPVAAPPKPTPPPAAPQRGAPAKPAATPAKPTPEERDRAEETRALLRAKRTGEELATTAKERDELRKKAADLEKTIAEAANASPREKERLAKMLREDFAGGLRELGLTLPDVTRHLLSKAGKGDPRDEVLAKMQAELEELRGWREETKKEREKREAEEAARAQERTTSEVFGAIHHATETSLRAWSEKPPETDEDREVAGGDALFAADLKEDPQGWAKRLLAYAQKYPNHDADQARTFYGKVLLKRARERAKIPFVGALLGGSTTDAPTDETGGNATADVPRTRPRKSSGGQSPPKSIPVHGLSLRERDELKKRNRQRMADRVRR